MKKILPIIAESSNGKSYKSHRYCADDELRIPSIQYEERNDFQIVKDKFGETEGRNISKPRDLSSLATRLSTEIPLFKYFLDGSRRTYKVDDLEINKRIFPVMAGQIGVACCERPAPNRFKPTVVDNKLVISLPTEANPDPIKPELFFNNLKEKINQQGKLRNFGINFSKVLSYSSRANTGESEAEAQKYEHLGIATIQDEMIDSEKRVVAQLTEKSLLTESNYLLKDGSLQYKPMKTGEFKELAKIRSNYRRVVGLSKSFNPELFRNKKGKSNASLIANLPLFHRTPAFMFQHDTEKQSYLGDYKFSIWYVRIRNSRYSESPFSGVLKLEKILMTDTEIESGLESDLIDVITANVINERNPVCYGNDKRWANHLYPIYLTEQFLKSKYLSDLHFLNLF